MKFLRSVSLRLSWIDWCAGRNPFNFQGVVVKKIDVLDEFSSNLKIQKIAGENIWSDGWINLDDYFEFTNCSHFFDLKDSCIIAWLTGCWRRVALLPGSFNVVMWLQNKTTLLIIIIPECLFANLIKSTIQHHQHVMVTEGPSFGVSWKVWNSFFGVEVTID